MENVKKGLRTGLFSGQISDVISALIRERCYLRFEVNGFSYVIEDKETGEKVTLKLVKPYDLRSVIESDKTLNDIHKLMKGLEAKIPID